MRIVETLQAQKIDAGGDGCYLRLYLPSIDFAEWARPAQRAGNFDGVADKLREELEAQYQELIKEQAK